MPEKAYSERVYGSGGVLLQVGLEIVLETENLRLAGLRPFKRLHCGEHSVSMIVGHVKLGWSQAIRDKGCIGWTLQQTAVAEQRCDDLEIICGRNGAHDMIFLCDAEVGVCCRRTPLIMYCRVAVSDGQINIRSMITIMEQSSPVNDQESLGAIRL